MKIEFEGTVDELRELMSGDNVGTDIAVIQLDEDDYSRIFDENSLLWTGCIERDLMTLQHIRNYACDLLNCKGYLFLNNVLGMLELQQTKNGQLVGWTYEKGMTVNDIFAIYRQYSEDKTLYLLKFKPQGIILDEI